MANIVRFDPFAEIQALQRQFFGDDNLTTFNGLQMPTTDIYTEDDTRMTIEIHLPNFTEKDVTINIDNGILEIHAERHEEEKDTKKKYVMRESTASFYRHVRLPDRADISKIDAAMEGGLLRITVPFKASSHSQKIAIKGKIPTKSKK